MQVGPAGQEVTMRRGSFVEVLIKRTETDLALPGNRFRCRIEDLYTIVSTGQRLAMIRKVCQLGVSCRSLLHEEPRYCCSAFVHMPRRNILLSTLLAGEEESMHPPHRPDHLAC